MTDDTGAYTLSYADGTAVEDVALDLLKRAGWSESDITCESTGMTISGLEFTKETYADAFELLKDITGFEVTIFADGTVYFGYPTSRKPKAIDDLVTLTGTDWVALSTADGKPIVQGSEYVHTYDESGNIDQVYTRDVDYEMDYGTGRIRRIDGGGIADGASVYVSYVYAAWVFQEGVDIVKIGYRMSRRNLYEKIVVIGRTENESGETVEVSGTYTYPNAATFGVEGKVLFVDIEGLSTAAACQQAAENIGANMAKKLREVIFAGPGTRIWNPTTLSRWWRPARQFRSYTG